MRSSTLLPAAAIAVVVLFVGGAAILGPPATGATSGPDLVAWFAANGWHVRAAVWLWTMQAIAAAVFIGLARNRIRAPHRDVFFVGGVTFVAETAVSTWTLGGLAWHAGQLEPATARTLLDISSFWGPVLNGSTVAMMAPVVLLSFGKQPDLPRWLGIVGLVAVAEQAIESVLTIFGQSGFTEPGGGMNLQLGAGLVSLWFICAGFGLARTAGEVGREASGGVAPAGQASLG